MNVQTQYTAPSLSFGSMSPPQGASAMDRVLLRHLRTESEIRNVLHLRDEIDLSAHLGAGSDFRSLEKKETNSGSSARSSSMGSS